jgi:hypothetical protein
MGKRQCDEREARLFIEKTDRERAQFVERYFHHALADPHLYDLIINLSRIPREDAVDLIATEAVRHQARVRSDALVRATVATLPK